MQTIVVLLLCFEGVVVEVFELLDAVAEVEADDFPNVIVKSEVSEKSKLSAAKFTQPFNWFKITD
jgi:hypothetical protein